MAPACALGAGKVLLDRIWPATQEPTGGGIILLFDAQDRDA